MLSLVLFLASFEGILADEYYDPIDPRFAPTDPPEYRTPPRPGGLRQRIYDSRGSNHPLPPSAYRNKKFSSFSGNEDNSMEKLLTRAHKWPEFIAKLREFNKKAVYVGAVNKNWEKDAKSWEHWFENLETQTVPPRRNSTTLRTILRIAESAENPSIGMEAYWPGAQQEQAQALGIDSMKQINMEALNGFRRKLSGIDKKTEAMMYQDFSKEETRLRTLYGLPQSDQGNVNMMRKDEQKMKKEYKKLGNQLLAANRNEHEAVQNRSGPSRYSRQAYWPPNSILQNQNSQSPNIQNRGPNFQNGQPPNFQNGQPPNFQNGQPPNFQNEPQSSPNRPPMGYQNMPQDYQNGPPLGYQNGSPPGYQNGPPLGYQNGSPPGYQNGPPLGYQNGSPPGYQNGPPRGYQNGPLMSYQNSPQGYQNGPLMGYQNGPPPGYQSGPPMGYQNELTGYQNEPPMSYQEGLPPGYINGPPMGYNNGPPMGYNNGPPLGYNNGPPMGYNNGPPMGYNNRSPMGHNNGPMHLPDLGTLPSSNEPTASVEEKPPAASAEQKPSAASAEKKAILRMAVTMPPSPTPPLSPPTLPTTVDLLKSYNLPSADDFFSPIRWVKFNSIQIRDGLAKVTDPDTGKNRQYTINDTIYVPIIDYTKVGGETTKAPVRTMGVIRRQHPSSKEMERIRKLTWMEVENKTHPDLQRAVECEDEGCSARCKTVYCKTRCFGDTCSAGCDGAYCHAECAGPGCQAVCIGDHCTSKCNGMSCQATCRKPECKSECTGFSCYKDENNMVRAGGGAFEEYYPEAPMPREPDEDRVPDYAQSQNLVRKGKATNSEETGDDYVLRGQRESSGSQDKDNGQDY